MNFNVFVHRVRTTGFYTVDLSELAISEQGNRYNTTNLHNLHKRVHCHCNLQDSDIQNATYYSVQVGPLNVHDHLHECNSEPLKSLLYITINISVLLQTKRGI